MSRWRGDRGHGLLGPLPRTAGPGPEWRVLWGPSVTTADVQAPFLPVGKETAQRTAHPGLTEVPVALAGRMAPSTSSTASGRAWFPWARLPLVRAGRGPSTCVSGAGSRGPGQVCWGQVPRFPRRRKSRLQLFLEFLSRAFSTLF